MTPDSNTLAAEVRISLKIIDVGKSTDRWSTSIITKEVLNSRSA